jgi:glycosyltransferase involved in cell wall biosynthesis
VTRVVHVVAAGEVGGAERMLADLASHPAETGAEHSIAVLSPSPALAALFRRRSIRVHDPGPVAEGALPFLRTSFGRRRVAWLASVLRREGARVVHLHTFASHVLGTRAALEAGARVLRTEHSTRVFDDPSCWPFSRWSLARTDASVAVSEHVLERAVTRAGWTRGRMRVVPNGVDLTHFAPRPRPPGGPFTFGIVGRLEPRKGVDLAIRAVARVSGVKLEVIGDGQERAALEALAGTLRVRDRVSFHGFLEDTRPAVEKCHAVLCASRSEGLGISLLEAMAMQRPVVGFKVGGVAEIVRHGRTGVLVDGGDLDGLARAMDEAAGAPERSQELGASAREHVASRFSTDVMCAGYARAYGELARHGYDGVARV